VRTRTGSSGEANCVGSARRSLAGSWGRRHEWRAAPGRPHEERGACVVHEAAALVDGALPPSRSSADTSSLPRLHISVKVEVSKAARPGVALNFECSVWPDGAFWILAIMGSGLRTYATPQRSFRDLPL
jgi:hypothetical protein